MNQVDSVDILCFLMTTLIIALMPHPLNLPNPSQVCCGDKENKTSILLQLNQGHSVDILLGWKTREFLTKESQHLVSTQKNAKENMQD